MTDTKPETLRQHGDAFALLLAALPPIEDGDGDHADASTGEVISEEEWARRFDELDMPFADKVGRCLQALASFEAEADKAARLAEVQRLAQKRAEAHWNAEEERLRARLLDAMKRREAAGHDVKGYKRAVWTPYGTVSFTEANKVVVDETVLSREHYYTPDPPVPRPEPRPDLMAIKADLKAGKVIPGAKLVDVLTMKGRA